MNTIDKNNKGGGLPSVIGGNRYTEYITARRQNLQLFLSLSVETKIKVTQGNIKYYKDDFHKAKVGDIITEWGLRDYESAQDLEVIFNREFNVYKEHFKGTEMKGFIVNEIAEITKWLSLIATNDTFNKYKDVLRGYLELLQAKQNSQPVASPVIEKGITVAAYGLMHAYWAKEDCTKAITKTNVDKWANKYGCSRNTLIRSYEKYTDRQNRLIVEGNKRAINEHIQRYENFLPLLKLECPPAFQVATQDLNTIKEKNI